MRLWQKFSFAGLVSLLLICSPARAWAQEGEGIVPVLRDVLLNVAGRVDTKLGSWVSGNALTDPEGVNFINELADFIASVASYIAACLGDLLGWLNYL